MASSLQAAIKKEFGLPAGLQEGHGGIFDVAIDGKLVYSKHETYRFPSNDEIFAKIRSAQEA
ncbi:MAG: Rdx family protein [Candidatus Rokuibacteriota bacterium]